MKPETIEVLCCITPSGDFLFAHNLDTADRVTKNWRAALSTERRQQHEAAGTYGGFVKIRMLKSEYEGIPCTNESYRLSRGGS